MIYVLFIQSINIHEIKCCIAYVIFLFLFGGLFILISMKRRNRLFQSESPQALISTFYNSAGPRFLTRISIKMLSIFIPYWKPARSYQNALIYTYYGQFDAARAELANYEWEKFPPYVQSDKKYIEALIAYLEQKDFKEGFELSIEALKLHQFSAIIPGKKILYSRFITLIEIGQLLNGNQDTGIVFSLERKFKRFPLMLKIPIAWALEKAYIQIGDTQKANQMRVFLNATAPHCVAFAQ